MGHLRSYVAIDAYTRKQRMLGKDVLYPMGWDAFGLPTENYAIKHKVSPQEATRTNIANFTRQMKALGLAFDWSREINTTDDAYVRWTQWQFLQFVKHGLAYKAISIINWCPTCKIGLANEEAQGGVCERCGNPVEKREKSQWMIAITKYADKLLADLDTVDYLDQVKAQQRNWIGKSEGAHIEFALVGISGQQDGAHKVKVFTTRPDTLFGATFLVVSPELAKTWLAIGWNASDEVRAYIEQALKRPDDARINEQKEKTGVCTGLSAINPANNEHIPVWIADYVLGGYGTGAIMAVPAHDERDYAFAKIFGLPIREVIVDDRTVNSGEFSGLPTWKAKEDIASWLEEHGHGARATTYKLRDWVFSRQRYWGEPIPMVQCPACGWVPVPDDQLPVLLPTVEAYEPTDTGESPLAKMRDWVEVPCPTCGGKAQRETDTMPNWAGSSWYFLRYLDPKNEETFASTETLKRWLPVDLYNGGMEHTTLHLLYSRFWYKFLFDIGCIPEECGNEPYAKRRSQGLILAPDGSKMSKSKGNVVSPDAFVQEYGADVVRTYTLFMGPYDQAVPWDQNGIEGVRKFLDRVWTLFVNGVRPEETPATRTLYHQTIKKLTNGIDALAFNTCVSHMMILLNAYKELGGIPKTHREGVLKILAPFAPHLAEELWKLDGYENTIHLAMWPSYDVNALELDEYDLIVQVNGKMRGKVRVARDISEEEARVVAMNDAGVEKWLEGKPVQKIVFVKGRLMNLIV